MLFMKSYNRYNETNLDEEHAMNILVFASKVHIVVNCRVVTNRQNI